jgi:uncharacterized membrane protein YbhN (UPF0104 family)
VAKKIFHKLFCSKKWPAIYNILKLSLFIVVLWILYRQTDNFSVKNFQLTAPKASIAIAFIVFQIRYMLMGVRIYFSARLQGVSVSLLSCISLVYRNWFLVFLVPLPDSEDLFKFLYFKNRQVPPVKAVQIILYDRIGALLALLFVGLVCLAIVFYAGGNPYFSHAIVVPFFSIAVMCVLAFTHRWWLKKMLFVFRNTNNQVVRRIMDIAATLSASQISAKVICVSFALSVLYHLCAFFVIIILLGNAFNAAQWAAIGLGIPLFYVSVIVPLSYQGVGLYETAMFAYLVFLKIPADLVFQVTLLHFIFDILLILTGGTIFLKTGEKFWIKEVYKEDK